MVRIEVVLAAFIVAAVVGSLAVITVNPAPASTTTSSSITTTTSTSVTTTATTTSTVSSTSSSSTDQRGIANGTIGIGPLQPVCFVNSTKGPPPSNIASIEVVITSSSGSVVYVPLNWSVYSKCEADAQFQVALQPGSYSLNLSSCAFLGCKNSLPKEFVVYPDLVTTVDVSIDTGIR